MTQNKRIVLNIIATYGRSVYAMVLGIFTARWVLEALGETDFGLYGVIGGFAAFIVFFNDILASAISRYFAFYIGRAKLAAGDDESGLEECRRWFSVAVVIHTVVPLVLIVIGYPVGMWAVDHYLVIPPERLAACQMVFRFVCVMSFFAMVTVPYSAMYTAKQYIAELTIYSVASVTIKAAFLGYVVLHPGDWLVGYALCVMIADVAPKMIIMFRAVKIFSECRFKLCHGLDWLRAKELAKYAGWQFFASLGHLMRTQGMAVLVNRHFGPNYNATMSMANVVAVQTESLSMALNGAISPVMTTAAGAGDKNYLLAMAYRSSKFSSVACLLFALPLMIEVKYVLELWLDNPPPQMEIACVLTILYMLAGLLLSGIDRLVIADGRIAKMMVRCGLYNMMILPVAWGCLTLGFVGFETIFIVLLISRCAVGSILFPIARELAGFSVRRWFVEVLYPFGLTAVATFCVVYPIHFCMEPGFIRLIIVSCVAAGCIIGFSWCFMLNRYERSYVTTRFSLLNKILIAVKKVQFKSSNTKED